MSDSRIPSVNDIQPGKLAVHRYNSNEIGIVFRISLLKDYVGVILNNGKIVIWGIEGFRSCYEVL